MVHCVVSIFLKAENELPLVMSIHCACVRNADGRLLLRPRFMPVSPPWKQVRLT